MNNLTQKTINGLFWSFLDSFGSYVVKFGFGIAIARALSPEDYGIMGMIVIFMAIGGILSESGFGMALIQKKDANQNDYSTVFWFNLFVAVVCYIILFFSAKIISEFYNQPILVIVTRISALGIILNALSIIHYVILSQKLDFKKQTAIRFLSAFITGIVGVILAYKGYAVWALIIQSLVGNIINTMGIWLLHKWKPNLTFSMNSFKVLYKYGYKIFLSGISDVIFTKIYFPLIGKYFPAAQLGYYTKANGFYDLLVRQTTIAYGRVTFPVFSSIQNQKDRFIEGYLKTYRLLAFMMFPLTLFAIVSSKPLINLFLTEKWLPVVPLMRVFFIEGFIFPFYMLNINIFNAIGKSAISLKIEILKKALTVLSIFVAFQYGIQALIIGQLVSSLIVLIVTTIVINHLQKIYFWHQINELSPIFLLTIICAILNLIIIDKINTSDEILILLKIILIFIIYIMLSSLIIPKILSEFIILFDRMIFDKFKRLFK
jgi:teichuronic acid exporter